MESSSPMFERDRGELAGGVSLPPPPRSRDRDGLSALERKALYRVHTELPAMPASLVVQILLWPEKITDWARDENVTPALVYNMLGGFKPYHGLRQRLAERLGVTKGAVDHLIDARRKQPSRERSAFGSKYRRTPQPSDCCRSRVSHTPTLYATKTGRPADSRAAQAGTQRSVEYVREKRE